MKHLGLRTFTYILLAFAAFPMFTFAQGPVVLMGIDAEDFGHPPAANYATVMSSIYTTASNGGTGALVIGGNKSGTDAVTTFWNSLVGTIGPITYVNGATAISTAPFTGYRMIAVVSDYLNTYSGGLTEAENEALTARAGHIAAFVNGGGGLVGFSSVALTTPYGYLGSIGTFTFGSVGVADITPTVAGTTIGVSDGLDGCCWHDSYLTFPSFLDVLATYPGVLGTPAAAIGGAQVIVTSSCPYSQGFWKTHGELGCAYGNNTNFWPASAFPMLLGTNAYSAVQACNTLHLSPRGGNALLNLSHQLIAAKLNIANGSPSPVPVPATIIQADLLIGALDVQSTMVKANTALGQQMNALAGILDLFNNNMIDPICIPSGATPKRGYTHPDELVAGTLTLDVNYPNPLTTSTSIHYTLETSGHAMLSVYNGLGQKVRELVNSNLTAGSFQAVWDGADMTGDLVPNGLYFVRLTMGDQLITSKLTVNR